MSAPVYTCGTSPQERNIQHGLTLVRVARELRGFVAGEDVPDDLRRDIDILESVGRWLATAQIIETPHKPRQPSPRTPAPWETSA